MIQFTNKRRLLCGTLIVLVTTSLFAACSSSGDSLYATPQSEYAHSEMAYQDEYEGYYEYETHDMAGEVGSVYGVATDGGDRSVQMNKTANQSERKIITTVDLRMESTQYDVCVNDIYRAIQEADGYIEYSDITGGIDPAAGASGVASSWNGTVTQLSEQAEIYYNTSDRSLYLRIRVPETNLAGFITRVEGLGNVLSKQESAEDITLQYVDVESRITSLKAEQEQLIALLEQCDNIEDMILLQDRLSYVRYQIESYESQLRVMQNQVSYSTVNLRLREVIVYTERIEASATIGQRISTGFSRTIRDIKEFWADFVVWVAVNSIYLVLPALVAVLAIVALRRVTRRAPKTKENQVVGSRAGDADSKKAPDEEI